MATLQRTALHYGFRDFDDVLLDQLIIGKKRLGERDKTTAIKSSLLRLRHKSLEGGLQVQECHLPEVSKEGALDQSLPGRSSSKPTCCLSVI
ncbi:hypothetical protein E2320_006997, partial [Naja naja]